MAKKTKTFSYVQAEESLRMLPEKTAGSADGKETICHLLRIFAGYGDGQIRRLKDGTGNAAKDGRTVIVKNLVAYRALPAGADHNKLHNEVEAMRRDPNTVRHSPRLYIASDGRNIAGCDPKNNDIYENTIGLMQRDFDFFFPLAGIEKIEPTEEAEADVKSAELMAKLFDDIRRYNDTDSPDKVRALNVFMSRLLFCFFAEDTRLFATDGMFTNAIKTHTAEDGSDLSEFISRAFEAMSTNDETERSGMSDVYRAFPYVNGGLFSERTPVPVLSRRARRLIINCGEYDWRNINPDIFGSMIQAVVMPEQRAGLGMHYTSVTNIDKAIRPLFLDALEEEFEAACHETRRQMAQYEVKRQGGMKQRKTPDHCVYRLRALLARLSYIRFFDPACGSGNFLIITYKRLRQLEIRIWQAMLDIAGIAELPFSSIALTQFYGIEIDDYACYTATLSLWLAEHQMNVMFNDAFGVQPETLPLKPSGHIICGNACRMDWNEVCPHSQNDEVYIMGNPPYLGSKLQNAAQKEDMLTAMKGTDAAKTVDYICAWFWKGALYIKGTRAKYAFVTTNSISQGEQVEMLWKPIFDLGLEIFFARTSFKWSNNAKYNAAVTVAVIGVAEKSDAKKRLFNEAQMNEKKVRSINPYLAEGENLFVTKSHKIPLGYPKAEFGCMPYDNGHLILDEYEKENIINEYPDAEVFIKQFMGSQEFIQDRKRYCLWIDDADKAVAETIKPIKERIEKTYHFRLYESKDGASLAERPHQFREHYEITATSKDKILIPSVSSERREYIPIGYVNKDTIISNLAFAVYNAELWLFALLTSKMHNIWVRAVGGRLGTGLRYSSTLCYNTFPFPKLNAEQKAELANLAQEIINIRNENYGMNLGEMYNPESMPDKLRHVHKALDLAVERCYRAEPFASDKERLEHLFNLYVKQTKTK